MNVEARIVGTSAQPTPIAGKLIEVLSDSYALMLATQICHWNVEGPQFFALHGAFETQYRELFAAVDSLAERLRSLGVYAPARAEAYLGRRLPQAVESPADAARMVRSLIDDHEHLAGTLGELLRAADEAGDDVTADLATRRLEQHAQTLWMLRSVVR